jgi:hypothetical protein
MYARGSRGRRLRARLRPLRLRNEVVGSVYGTRTSFAADPSLHLLAGALPLLVSMRCTLVVRASTPVPDVDFALSNSQGIAFASAVVSRLDRRRPAPSSVSQVGPA